MMNETNTAAMAMSRWSQYIETGNKEIKEKHALSAWQIMKIVLSTKQGMAREAAGL